MHRRWCIYTLDDCIHSCTHICHVIAYVFTYVPGSLYAICRAHRHIDGLRGWRARSHAYCMLYAASIYVTASAFNCC
uniref:Uncharacterized protein n=1 Tax=Nelumbo nucifera TaxID=4432 RepID=A0A822Y637_NELNU|nr:TPA_asm: hypothetical protein HUJ06_029448 [Nelumbo nucifera]